MMPPDHLFDAGGAEVGVDPDQPCRAIGCNRTRGEHVYVPPPSLIVSHPFTRQMFTTFTCDTCGLPKRAHATMSSTSLPLALAATRVGREGDTQALPRRDVGGTSVPVTQALVQDFVSWGEGQHIDNTIIGGITQDLGRRTELGVQRYGSPLMTFNGRNATLDAYEEALDLAQYLRQRVMENTHNGHYVLALWNTIAIVISLKEDLSHS